ncbi:aminotransferase class IV, partial [Staphylococcus saprophyticus]|uniref:aminotransferase class IV n=1 Tax=Staphylococcus saprophyticus TaxID=29385 RepID=UPI001642484B
INPLNNQLKHPSNLHHIKHITSHPLTHTHSSYLLPNDLSIYYISKTLRHKNISLTTQIYSHLFQQKYLQELPTINIFFLENRKFLTPQLNPTILPPITRNTVIHLAQNLPYQLEQPKLSIHHFIQPHNNRQLTQLFPTPTPPLISPLPQLKYPHTQILINNNQTPQITQNLYHHYTPIQTPKLHHPQPSTLLLPTY